MSEILLLNSSNNIEKGATSGTFTPTIGTTGAAYTGTVYTAQVGEWHLIGDMVFINVYVGVSANSGGSGNFIILGLPFTAVSSYNTGACYTTNLAYSTGRTSMALSVNASSSYAILVQFGSNVSAVTYAATLFTGGSFPKYVVGSINYRI